MESWDLFVCLFVIFFVLSWPWPEISILLYESLDIQLSEMLKNLIFVCEIS